jgi:hypothetical protein
MDNLGHMCKCGHEQEEHFTRYAVGRCDKCICPEFKPCVESEEVKLCFRCGEPIDVFYVLTLSNEYAHPYCQARGIRKVKQVTEE